MGLVRAVIVATSALLLGCIHAHYTKTVQVSKDASGRVTGTTVTEVASQNDYGWPLKFEYLRGVKTNDDDGPDRSRQSRMSSTGNPRRY